MSDKPEQVVRRGWRFFSCHGCGNEWKTASRDRFSPSGENCPKCEAWTFPHADVQDESLLVDKSGNLLKL